MTAKRRRLTVKPRKLEAAPLSKDGKITDRGLERLVSAIESGEDVHPDDVRAAMRRIHESDRGIEGELMLDQFESAYLSLATARFLDGAANKLSLDQAFARRRSRVGNPGVPVHAQLRMARAVWEQFLPGTESLDVVAKRVGDVLGKGKTQLLKYFYGNFQSSYISFVLRGRRPRRGNTPDENRRYTKLYREHLKREGRLAEGARRCSVSVRRRAPKSSLSVPGASVQG